MYDPTIINRYSNKETSHPVSPGYEVFLVPVVGLEPTRYRYQRILSPPRLPFQHTGIFNFYTAMDEIPNIGGISKCYEGYLFNNPLRQVDNAGIFH